jgi:hypothetical protein
MKHQRHFETSTAVQTRKLIGDLDRVVRILSGDIAREEEQAGIFNRLDPEYPSLARALAARRDNLMATIAVLEARIETMAEPHSELTLA